MINLKDVFLLDFAYLETFTKRINTPWGSIFCNESQPSYYDANHAHISVAIDNPKLKMGHAFLAGRGIREIQG